MKGQVGIKIARVGYRQWSVKLICPVPMAILTYAGNLSVRLGNHPLA